MTPAQLVGQLLWIASHLDTELFQRHDIDLILLGLLFQHLIGRSDGIETKEFDDRWDVSPIDRPPMLPVSYGRGGHADLVRGTFLVQTKFETTQAQVVTEGVRFLKMIWRCYDFQRTFDFAGRIENFRKLENDVLTLFV